MSIRLYYKLPETSRPNYKTMFYAKIPYPWGIKLGKEYPTYLGTFEDTLGGRISFARQKIKELMFIMLDIEATSLIVSHHLSWYVSSFLYPNVERKSSYKSRSLCLVYNSWNIIHYRLSCSKTSFAFN